MAFLAEVQGRLRWELGLDEEELESVNVGNIRDQRQRSLSGRFEEKKSFRVSIHYNNWREQFARDRSSHLHDEEEAKTLKSD